MIEIREAASMSKLVWDVSDFKIDPDNYEYHVNDVVGEEKVLGTEFNEYRNAVLLGKLPSGDVINILKIGVRRKVGSNDLKYILTIPVISEDSVDIKFVSYDTEGNRVGEPVPGWLQDRLETVEDVFKNDFEMRVVFEKDLPDKVDVEKVYNLALEYARDGILKTPELVDKA